MHKTGATRYQKFLKAEKAKTKLKGKKDKELPKGTNVTKTNFKVKKIVIKEQLKKHLQSEALTSRKLNIKELLSRLNHFNTKSRTDALDGLKEIITSFPEVLERNLGQLLLNVTPLVLNIEKLVRQGSLKVLHLILSNVSSEKIEPFFDIMSTYLRSAMTHIDSRIQEDSLFFLDILLLCAPSKVAQDFHKIIPNFLDMISKLRVDSKPGRTLTVNLNSQITTVKWRVKVFQRLQEFLQKYELECFSHKESQISSNKTHKVDLRKKNYYTLFNPIYTSNCYISCYSAKAENEQEIDEVEKFKEYVGTLTPLLYDTWLEAAPSSKSNSNFETVINEETALLLKYILGTFKVLGSILEYLNKKCPSSNIKNLYFQKISGPYSQHFVSSFPYVTNIRSKQTSSEDSISDPKLVTENLEICKLFIMFNPKVSMKHQEKEIKAVINYIEKIFNKNHEGNINDTVIKLLDLLFSNEITGWTKDTLVLDNLFDNILVAYSNKTNEDFGKQKVFTLLCKIALNEKLSHFHSNENFKVWLQSLPNILLSKQLSVQTIDMLHKFAVTNNKMFNAVIKSKLLTIIKNLPQIEITDSTVDSNGYHKLLSIFYWVKVWDTESLNHLEMQLMENVYKPDHVKYIFDTLRLRSGGLV
ncbi:unnamed protein product [Danaus chrysippus]|uniref:(African queen) hypothetical protein n=1 Tax=Danaus chrysippus TaxID=151541 RepID=A0A8J2W0F2_9NEOP|nr:unnamed protein product [Danaus chrysippus]